MSHLPPGPPMMPGQPVAYYQTAPARPTSVTVLSIIVLVLDGLALLCSPLSLIQLFGPARPMASTGQPNPVLVLLAENQVLRVWTMFSTAVGLLLAAAFVLAAINSLRMKPTGRRLMVRASIANLLLGLAGLGVTIFVTMPPLMTMARNATQPAERYAAIGGVIGGIVGPIIGAILPALILYFFQTPYVVDAFEPKVAADSLAI